MATLVKTITTKRGTWFVDTRADNIIGQGAYGIVYRGTDEKGNEIAAKRIDTQRKRGLGEKLKDIHKLMELDHPNIVKVHDIHEEEGIVWIFMGLCEHGDLNKFVRKNGLDQEQAFSVMKQIAEGIAYLHRRNIIHRDIKPENILVSSDSPIQVKLTDFDVSKFLDEFYKTSAMSTNVGTLAYKAPEFFQRKKDGQLVYHRKVDCYAAGLTYLAILQAKPKQKQLVPHIETAREDSELYAPSIGQLITERIKYNVPDIDIVVISHSSVSAAAADPSLTRPSGTSVESGGYDFTAELKKIILKMTRANPEDRCSAAQVVEALQDVEQNMRKPKLARIRLEEERRKEELREKFRDVKLDRTSSWKIEMSWAFTMCVVGDQLLVQGQMGSKAYIRVFNRNDGGVVRNIESTCVHVSTFQLIIENTTEKNHILESCPQCKLIRCYNINTDESQIVYRGTVERICPGPSGSVLCVDREGRIEQLDTQGEGQEFKVKHSVQTGVSTVWWMCYVEQYNIVVFTCPYPGRIAAVSLGDGSPLWEFKEQVEGKNIDPVGLCHDNNGRIYVTDNDKERLLVLEPQRGQLLQVLPVNESVLYHVCWADSPPQLSVVHDYGRNISVYNVNH